MDEATFESILQNLIGPEAAASAGRASEAKGDRDA